MQEEAGIENWWMEKVKALLELSDLQNNHYLTMMHGLIPGLLLNATLVPIFILELFRFIAGFGVYATGQMLEGRSGLTLQEGSQPCSE